MAKVILEIEDTENGNARRAFKPSLKEARERVMSGEESMSLEYSLTLSLFMLCLDRGLINSADLAKRLKEHKESSPIIINP